jgi:acyl carrier protein
VKQGQSILLRRTGVGDHDLFERLVKHLGEYLETDASYLKPESRVATAVAGLDSLKMLELILYLEDAFGIKVDEKAIDHLDTLHDLEAYIKTRLPANPAVI